MSKKINWFSGKNAINPYDMQELCNQLANTDTPQNLANVIKGSETVVVDVSEDEKSLEIHLDAETTADISRSLKTPVSAPATTQLVAVDTTNSQEMLTIGSGLSIENGVITASGSGAQLYAHYLDFTFEINQTDMIGRTQRMNAVIISTKSDAYNNVTIKEYFTTNNINSIENGISVNGDTLLFIQSSVAYTLCHISRVWYTNNQFYCQASIGITADTSPTDGQWYVSFDGFGSMMDIPGYFNVDFDKVIELR